MTDRELMQRALDALEHCQATEPIWKTPIREAIEALRARLDGIPLSAGFHPRGKRVADDVSEDALETVEIEAPVQIDDEYVRKYLWEHNLVAVDEGDLRKLMPPRRLLTAPALMEQAGWVRKNEWQSLTDEDKEQCIQATVKRGSIHELISAIEAKLREKNG